MIHQAFVALAFDVFLYYGFAIVCQIFPLDWLIFVCPRLALSTFSFPRMLADMFQGPKQRGFSTQEVILGIPT